MFCCDATEVATVESDDITADFGDPGAYLWDESALYQSRLRSYRVELRRRIYGRTKAGAMLKHQVPIRSERWSVTKSGWCEVDLVARCGGSGFGESINSVDATDVARHGRKPCRHCGVTTQRKRLPNG